MQILYNARIYTLDSKRPRASAIAIETRPVPHQSTGRILAVGDDEALLAHFGNPAGENATKTDMEGQVILPGLTDAHIHLETYALGLRKVDCETDTRQACLQRVAERARTTPPGEWILGHGWNQNNWDEGFGTASDLDQAAPDHPVYLTAKSLHAAWVNHAALRLAGLDDRSPDPDGGKLGRDENHVLNGILFEGAMELVSKLIPETTLAGSVAAIRAAQPILWKMGITGVHDFDRSRCFSALQVLNQEDQLQLRVLKSIPLERLPEAIALGLRTGFGDDFLRIGSVKAFADGALGPQTAAMLQPYENQETNRGMLLLDAEELLEHGRSAVQGGLSLAVHAIGDRANHEVLNAFEQLRQFEQGNALPALRHRIEHVQLIHPDDAPRLAELGVIASMQPIHATSDMQMADRYWGERSDLAYAWRTQLSYGATLAAGSDAPVESPNPFLGLHAAVTRQRLDGSPGSEGWHPEQRLSLEEALQAYTSGPAFAANLEYQLGKLHPGYLADLILLERDPFECTPAELAQLHPVGTMVGGNWVWHM